MKSFFRLTTDLFSKFHSPIWLNSFIAVILVNIDNNESLYNYRDGLGEVRVDVNFQHLTGFAKHVLQCKQVVSSIIVIFDFPSTYSHSKLDKDR